MTTAGPSGPLTPGILRVVARFGFLDEPHIMRVLLALAEAGHGIDPRQSTFFLGRERLLSSKHHGLGPFRGKLYAFVAHNALPATAFFQIPPDRVVEVGSRGKRMGACASVRMGQGHGRGAGTEHRRRSRGPLVAHLSTRLS